jgi:TrpR-related protein YerC/YecD
MSKVKPHQIDPDEKVRIIENFFNIVMGLKSRKEMMDFFMGLLTVSESLMMARRIQVAEMLLENKSYEEIRKKLRVGFQIITKTDQWLNSGDATYNTWLKKQIRKGGLKKASNDKGKYLTDKYPYHRIMKEILK